MKEQTLVPSSYFSIFMIELYIPALDHKWLSLSQDHPALVRKFISDYLTPPDKKDYNLIQPDKTKDAGDGCGALLQQYFTHKVN